MPSDPSAARSARALLLLLLALPLLSGCYTVEMWQSYEAERAAPLPVFVAARGRQVQGALLTSPATVGRGMAWVGAGGGERWFLRPKDDADVAAALLRDAAFCTVERADVAALRTRVDYTVTADAADLALQLRVRPQAVTADVDVARLPERTRAVLEAERRNAFLVAADPDVELSAACSQCLRRVATTDVGALVGEPGRWHVASFAFVDDRGVVDGAPAVPGDGAVLGFDERAPSVHQRLQALRTRRLLLKLRRVDDERVVALRADRAWLLGALQVGDRPGDYLHRSSWHLEPARAGGSPPPGDAVLLESTLALQERFYSSVYPYGVDGGFLGRVVLTPFTLTGDLVFGPAFRTFMHNVFGHRGPSQMTPTSTRGS